MFAKAEVFQVFPTCIWAHEVAEHERLNQALVAEIQRLERDAPGPPTPHNAWQSADDLHNHRAFAPFCEVALAGSVRVLEFLKCSYDDVYLTSCWANVNRIGYFHRDHVHANNFLSGVYYVKAPPNSGSIVFSDPRPQAQVLAPSVTERTLLNTNEYRIAAQEGRMVLFPSWLQHMVEINQSEEERISIAFNTMLKGHMGVAMAHADF